MRLFRRPQSAPTGALFIGARRLARALAGLLLGLAGLACPPLWAIDAPAAMLIDGRIGMRLALPPVFATSGDRVLAFAAQDGRLVGQGIVGLDGDFVVEAVQPATFNDTLLRLELQKGRVRYQLLQDGRTASLVFRGGLLPRRLTLGLRIGEVTALLPEAPPAAGPSRASANDVQQCDMATMDVNDDGLCDAADLAILALYGAGVTRSAPAARPLP